MKRKSILIVGALSFMSAPLFAQDNNDVSDASHNLDLNVPEVALIDIYDNNTSAEAATITFDMADVTATGVNREAGLYAFGDISYTDLWLNYTSVTGGLGSGFDVTRQIDVQMEIGSTFPGNLDLRITPEAPVIVTDGGDANSAGTITAGGVALGVSTAIGVDATLVNSIESVYTGDGTQGVKLTYTLEQNGNFAGYQAGMYSASLKYTISDL